MSANAVAERREEASIIESVIARGDLSKLNPEERTRYYVELCKSVGLNPMTQPLAYITLNGKLTLYALKGCTDQLRSIHDVSVEELSESEREGVLIVTAKVKNAKGRTDIAKGAVTINGLKGDALANAVMKAETKAKRRATLSICGLGILDETEIDAIPEARPANGNARRTKAEIQDNAARKRTELADRIPQEISQITSLAELARYKREVLTDKFMAGLGNGQWAVEEYYGQREAELKALAEEELTDDEPAQEDAVASEALRDELIERIEAMDTAGDLMRLRERDDFKSALARLPKPMQLTVRRYGASKLEKLPAEAV